jgi:hypothetical protein
MPRSIGQLHLNRGRRVDELEPEQGQGGGGGGDDGDDDGDGSFVFHQNTNSTSTVAELSALFQTHVLDANYDETVSVGTNAGLFDATAGAPKYVSIVAGGATKTAVESTDEATLGKAPLDPFFAADLAAAAAAGLNNVCGRMHLSFSPVEFGGASNHTVTPNSTLAGQFHLPQYSLNKTKLAALAASGFVRVGIRFERLFRTEHFTGQTTVNTAIVSGQGVNRFVIGFSRTQTAGVPGENTYNAGSGEPNEPDTSGMPEFGFHIFDNHGSTGQTRFYRYLHSVSPSSSFAPGPQTCVQDGTDGNSMKGTFELTVDTSSPHNVSLRGPQPQPGDSEPKMLTFTPNNHADLFADSGFAESDSVFIDGCHYSCGS